MDTAQWARHTAGLLAGNGVVPGFADEMQVVPTAPESLAVDVSLGRSWVEGRYHEVFSAAETVALATADPTNPRIDRIVVRRSTANREVTVEALTGTPGVSPSAPALTQSAAGDWEESLAQVAVAANETTIAAGDITDERQFSATMGTQLRINTAKFTTNSSDVTTTEAQVMSVTASLKTNRVYRVTAHMLVQGDTSNEQFRVRIRENNVSGNTLQLHPDIVHNTGIARSMHVEGEYTPSTDETKTFSCTLFRVTSGAPLRRQSAGTFPAFFYVDYIRG